jgi:hypothetical protein
VSPGGGVWPAMAFEPTRTAAVRTAPAVHRNMLETFTVR